MTLHYIKLHTHIYILIFYNFHIWMYILWYPASSFHGTVDTAFDSAASVVTAGRLQGLEGAVFRKLKARFARSIKILLDPLYGWYDTCWYMLIPYLGLDLDRAPLTNLHWVPFRKLIATKSLPTLAHARELFWACLSSLHAWEVVTMIAAAYNLELQRACTWSACCWWL